MNRSTHTCCGHLHSCSFETKNSGGQPRRTISQPSIHLKADPCASFRSSTMMIEFHDDILPKAMGHQKLVQQSIGQVGASNLHATSTSALHTFSTLTIWALLTTNVFWQSNGDRCATSCADPRGHAAWSDHQDHGMAATFAHARETHSEALWFVATDIARLRPSAHANSLWLRDRPRRMHDRLHARECIVTSSVPAAV